MRTAIWETYVEGPRWAKVSNAVRKGVMELGITLDYIHVEKGLLRETTFFKVSGDESGVTTFRRVLLNALEDYNA